MTTPIQILELMDPGAASELTNAIKMFEETLNTLEYTDEGEFLRLISCSQGFKDVLKGILGIKQNDNSLEQIEHFGSNSGL